MLVDGLYDYNYRYLSTRSWSVYLLSGILLVLLGAFCVTFSVVSSVLTAFVLGAILLTKSLVVFGKLVSHCVCRTWADQHQCALRAPAGVWSHFLLALIALVCGVLLMVDPIRGAMDVTLLLGLFLLCDGTVQISFGCARQFHDHGWQMLNGWINVGLGILVLASWPSDSFWVLGLLVGMDILFYGFALTVAACTFPVLDFPGVDQNTIQ